MEQTVLGFLGGRITNDIYVFQSKVGGNACYLNERIKENGSKLELCDWCGGKLKLFSQMYLINEDFTENDRWIYVFFCEDAKCMATGLKNYRELLQQNKPVPDGAVVGQYGFWRVVRIKNKIDEKDIKKSDIVELKNEQEPQKVINLSEGDDWGLGGGWNLSDDNSKNNNNNKQDTNQDGFFSSLLTSNNLNLSLTGGTNSSNNNNSSKKTPNKKNNKNQNNKSNNAKNNDNKTNKNNNSNNKKQTKTDPSSLIPFEVEIDYENDFINNIKPKHDSSGATESLGGEQFDEEEYQRTDSDLKNLKKFQRVLAHNPDQLIRYYIKIMSPINKGSGPEGGCGWGPIWIDQNQFDSAQKLKCQTCGMNRKVEVQILPAMLETLRTKNSSTGKKGAEDIKVQEWLREVDYSMITIYTCFGDCGGDGEWIEEYAFLQ